MRRRRPVYDVQLNPLTSDNMRAWADSHEPGSPPWLAAQTAVDEAEAFGDLTPPAVLTTAQRLLRLETEA